MKTKNEKISEFERGLLAALRLAQSELKGQLKARTDAENKGWFDIADGLDYGIVACGNVVRSIKERLERYRKQDHELYVYKEEC